MILVFDSSALIALLADEDGANQVEALLRSASDEGEGFVFFAHAVNLAEVYWHVLARYDHATAEAAIQTLASAGIQERGDLDGVFWRDVAALVVKSRQMPKPTSGRGNLAMGDAFGIALSNRLGADFVTSDRTEIEPLEGAGMVSAHFIR